MPHRSKSEIALQSREDVLLALAEATALASALVLTAAEALQARADARLLGDAPSVAPHGPKRLPSRSPPVISEDEFGAWSRTLIERRVDGRGKGGR